MDEDDYIEDYDDYIEDDYEDDDCVEDSKMNQGYPIEGTEITSEVYKTMDEWNAKMAGIAYTILMRNTDDSLTLHVRSNTPCYGELRKYVSTHGDKATQPEDRPSDLYWPFPDGTPVAVGVRFDQRPSGRYHGVSEVITHLLRNDSPWRRGFGTKDDVIQTENGLIFKNTEIDPTVLVHLLKVIQNLPERKDFSQYFGDLSDLGFFAKVFLESYLNPLNRQMLSPDINCYVWNINFDAQRYLGGDPHDLTGGTLRDRFDYSRANLQNVFKGDFNLMRAICKHGKMTGYRVEFPTPQAMQDAIRGAWAECLIHHSEEVKVA